MIAKMKLIALCAMAMLGCGVALGATAIDRLDRKGEAGRIAVRSKGKRLPGNAEVRISRTRSESTKRKLSDGIKSFRRRPAKGGRLASAASGSPLSAAKEPAVLAMYDISINANGKKWQPAAGEPVQVDVTLDEPVAVADAAKLAIAHMADDGTVEELSDSNYGFTYNADKTAVTAFWFNATGFSIYTIIETEGGDLLEPRRFYHFYGYEANTANQVAGEYIPYVYKDSAGDDVNIQIVKDGDLLVEPPIPRSIVDEDNNVVSLFKGWYVVATNSREVGTAEVKLDTESKSLTWPVGVTDNRVVFTNVIQFTEQQIAEKKDFDYYVLPLYENARFLLFRETEGGSKLVGRKLVALNDDSTESERVLVTDVKAPLVNLRDEYFCGWSYIGTDNQRHELLAYTPLGVATSAYIEVTDDLFRGGDTITLDPIYVQAHFLNFSSAARGATYVDSLFVRSNSEITKLGTSSRNGYAFDGWYLATTNEYGTVIYNDANKVTDGEGNVLANLNITLNGINVTSAANGKIMLNADTTLYARWKTNEKTTYRVIVWQQKITDPKNAPDESKTYDYVEYYVSEEVDSNTEIAASHVTNFTGTNSDGNTVTRQNLTTRSYPGFHYRTYASTHVEIAPEGTTVINVYYDRKLVRYTFSQGTPSEMTGLYGQTLEANGYVWPTGNGLWQSGGTIVTFRDAFLPISGTETESSIQESFTWNQSTGTTPIRFYKQALDGSWTLANTVNTSGGNFNISDKYNGFTAYQYRKRNYSWGNWTSVGNYNQSTKYYGSAVSNYTELEIHFARNKYNLVFMDGDTPVHTESDIYYETSLSDKNLAAEDVNWGTRDTEHYRFMGWCEDASLTVPFNFNSPMPVGGKVLYANWKPVKFKVIIDPNGGTLVGNDATWFYLDYNELIGEYHPVRDYYLDMLYGDYGYSIAPYDPLKDKYVSGDPPPVPATDRHAYYVPYAERTENLDPSGYDAAGKRYSYEKDAYLLMGWFEVLENGTLAEDPFNFTKPCNKDITLRAVWRRNGKYTLTYKSVNPDDPSDVRTFIDPPSEGAAFEGYADTANATVLEGADNFDANNWILEGWQAIDTLNGDIPVSDILSPGDIYIVRSAHADRQGVIHFRAVYTLKDDGSSRHVPKTVDLVLDSNANAGFAPDASIAEISGRRGTYTDGTVGSLNGLNQGVWFAGQMDNFSVPLINYADDFAHNYGYFLLGWDARRNCTDLIPQFAADATIGTDKSTASANVLYAVWEPQIFITFRNETGVDVTDITFEVPTWASGELFRVNAVTGTYTREPFTGFVDGTATFSLAADEELTLVLPDAENKGFSVSGASEFEEGTKLIVTRTSADGTETISSTAYPGTGYLVTGVMEVSETPVLVTFTKDTYLTETTVPVRYFLHEPDGAINEITGVTSSDTWSDTTFKKTLTVAGSQIDLAAELRRSTTTNVNGYLASDVLANHGHTTIGIGSTTGINEYRAIATKEVSGGPYIRFVNEKVEWMLDGQDGIAYDDVAVYVIFYKRVPVPITVTKSVVGTDADKNNANSFPFKMTFEEHSLVVTRIATTNIVATRTVVERRSGTTWSEYNDDWIGRSNNASTQHETGPLVEIPTPVNYEITTTEDVVTELFDVRPEETFNLADGQSHSATIFYDTRTAIDSTTKSSIVPGDRTYYYWDRTTDNASNRHSNSGNWLSNVTNPNNYRYRYSIVTTNWTETVTKQVVYRYETVVLKETETGPSFELTGIAHEQDGTTDLNARTYTISSWKSDGDNVYTYQSPDAVTFTNTRTTSDLVVTKSVVNGESGHEFGFVVTLGDALTGFSADGVTVSADGKNLSFSLAHGGTRTLSLPVGVEYSVIENADARYAPSVDGPANGTLGMEGATVAFTNTRKTDFSILVKDKETSYNESEQFGYGITSVTGTSDSEVTDNAYTVTGLANGDVLSVVGYVMASGTDAGTYSNGAFGNAVVTVTRAGEDVTGMYNLIGATPGSLTINKTPVTVTVAATDKTVPYNGEMQEFVGDYTATIKDAEGHDITGSSISVVVGSDYRVANGKDVGEYPMNFNVAGAVVVNANPNYIVTMGEITNGKLVITPAAVTVTADDKDKILGCSEPALTATLSGLFGDDTVSYTLARESGEAVGTYTITPTVTSSDNPNYVVTPVNGTFTIGTPALIQRANGEAIPIASGLNDALLATFSADVVASGGTVKSWTIASLGDYLNAWQPNGLRRWENFRIGTLGTQQLLDTATGEGANQLKMGMAEDPKTITDFQYNVRHVLRRYVDGAWETIGGPVLGDYPNFSNPSFKVDLLDAEGKSKNASGFYRVYTQIIPFNREDVVNEIPSTNIIAVLEVNSGLKKTMTAIPWVALPSDPDAAALPSITVNNYVQTGQLSAGDAVYSIDANGIYEKWMLGSGDGNGGGLQGATPTLAWTSVTTVANDSSGVMSVQDAPDPATHGLSRGAATWVERTSEGKPYFLVGQYAPGNITVNIAGGSDTVPASTIIANPSINALPVNSIAWGDNPTTKDTIEVYNDKNICYNLQWNMKKKEWGRSAKVWDDTFKAYRSKWQNDFTIPAGTGVRYKRCGGAFTVTISADQVKETVQSGTGE